MTYNERDDKGRFTPGHTVNTKSDEEKFIRTQITLRPEQIAWLDKQSNNRSKALRQLIDKEMKMKLQIIDKETRQVLGTITKQIISLR